MAGSSIRPVARMRPAHQGLPVFVVSVGAAVVALAQEPSLPTGTWQSVTHETYTHPLHPVVTRAEVYLDIDVANDGTFRGEWGEYFCTGAIGASGSGTFSCRFSTSSGRVSGRFGPAGQGVIDLERLGRSRFTWGATADELAIDLPRNWQDGHNTTYHRARLTRDGKGKPATPARDAEPLLSANALYHEFDKDSKAALARYGGKTLVLEGRRGTLIPLSDGGAAVHVPDGFLPRALVLMFRDLNQVSGISEGTRFRFKCTVEDFAYEYLHMNDCSIVP